MADERTDSALVAAFAEGDASAMEELVSRYRRPLFSWFMLQVSDKGTAEDLYQDVWLKVIRGASAFHDVSFKAWMWRIARNRLIDFRRKMRPDLTLDQPVSGTEGEADAPSNVDRVADERANVAEAMQGDDRAVEKILDRGAGLLDVEDVAAHQQRVGPVLVAPRLELAEEVGVLVEAVIVLVQNLADMQVGSVQYSHRQRLTT